MTLAAPTFDPMVLGDDLYTGTAYALNRASEGFDISRPATGEPARFGSVAVADATSSDAASVSDEGRSEEGCGRGEGDFEPMVVGDDLYVGVAYSLNRASEGLGIAPEGFSSRSPADALRVSQLSVALRLTREAVFAWSNLLHGPAVVAISR